MNTQTSRLAALTAMALLTVTGLGAMEASAKVPSRQTTTTRVATTTAPPTTTPAVTAVSPPTNVRLRTTPLPTEASVTWTASADTVFYTVLLNGVDRRTDTCSGGPYCFGEDAVSATFRNLTPNTTYRVVVVANRYAAFGGGSAPSAEFVFTTPTA